MVADMRGSGPENRAPLESAEIRLRDLARTIKAQCPKGWGFVLVLGTFEAPGFMTFASSVQRLDAIKLLEDMALTLRQDARSV